MCHHLLSPPFHQTQGYQTNMDRMHLFIITSFLTCSFTKNFKHFHWLPCTSGSTSKLLPLFINIHLNLWKNIVSLTDNSYADNSYVNSSPFLIYNGYSTLGNGFVKKDIVSIFSLLFTLIILLCMVILWTFIRAPAERSKEFLQYHNLKKKCTALMDTEKS